MTVASLPGKVLGPKARTAILAALHWALRPVRAIALAYSYVLSGKKVTTPINWKDI